MTRTCALPRCQAEPRRLNLAAGVAQVVELIAEASCGGADLVALPETFLPGNPWWIWPDSSAGGIIIRRSVQRDSEAAHIRGRC